MVQQTRDLVIKDANNLPAPRGNYPKKPLDGDTEGMLVSERRDLVEPIEVGNILKVRPILYQFLGSTMKKANMGVDSFDNLAVQFED